MGFSSRFMPLNMSPRMRLDDVVKRISNLPFEDTDCALPMIWAHDNGVTVSAFMSDAKAVVVGMTSNGFTLADPNDRGMLDAAGLDATAPTVIADFIRH